MENPCSSSQSSRTANKTLEWFWLEVALMQGGTAWRIAGSAGVLQGSAPFSHPLVPHSHCGGLHQKDVAGTVASELHRLLESAPVKWCFTHWLPSSRLAQCWTGSCMSKTSRGTLNGIQNPRRVFPWSHPCPPPGSSPHPALRKRKRASSFRDYISNLFNTSRL